MSETLFSSNPKKIYKYVCNCIVCNGKEVEPKTQKKHANDKILWKSKSSRRIQLAMIEARKHNYGSKIINLKYKI